MKLRILFFGIFEGKGDEALSNISKQFYGYFKIKHNILCLHPSDAIKPRCLFQILKFKPQIIHHLTGPTIRSFLVPWLLNILLLKRAKILLSATRVYLNKVEIKFIRFFKPNLILTQASKWRRLFQEKDIPTLFIPNFVDRTKFRSLPSSIDELRIRYNLPRNKKLILHVGHIRPNRQLSFLGEIQLWAQTNDRPYQVVIVGGTFFQKDSDLMDSLQHAGCIVINEYIERIEELYNACDFYVFPIEGLGSGEFPKAYHEVGVTDIPLSILEAFACGMFVITTEIDAINVLLKDMANPPMATFEKDIHSFEEALNKIDSQSDYDFAQICHKIDRVSVLSQIDNIYKKLVLRNEK